MKEYILVLDSGLGGLNILKSLKNTFINENFLYVLDNKNCPYGNKDKDFLVQNAINLIDKFLSKFKIKLIVFACNTLTSVAINDVRKHLKHCYIKNLAIKATEKISQNLNMKRSKPPKFSKKVFKKYKKINFNIFVIGTEPPIKMVDKNQKTLIISTKATLIYNKTLKEYFNNENFTFVALENIAKMVDDNFFNRLQIIKSLKQQIPQKNYENVVLGCTHYYYLEKEIKQVLDNPSIKFFSATNGVINRVKSLLKAKNVKKNQKNTQKIKIFLTKFNLKLFNTSKKIIKNYLK